MTTLDKMLQGLANALGASLSTLTTTAKTVVGAINELKTGLTTANTNISTNTTKIGTGNLNTTAQTLIPAVNELAARGISITKRTVSKTNSDTSTSSPGTFDIDSVSFNYPFIVFFVGTVTWKTGYGTAISNSYTRLYNTSKSVITNQQIEGPISGSSQAIILGPVFGEANNTVKLALHYDQLRCFVSLSGSLYILPLTIS